MGVSSGWYKNDFLQDMRSNDLEGRGQKPRSSVGGSPIKSGKRS